MTEGAAVSNTSANSDASRRKFPIIIGTVFGGLALLVIVSIVIVFAKRRERKQTLSQLDNAKEV
jgi:preprotein translocase subunit SecY